MLVLEPKPCSSIRYFSSIIRFRRLSKRLNKLGNSESEIGQYEYSGGFPGLGNIITCVWFHFSNIFIYKKNKMFV